MKPYWAVPFCSWGATTIFKISPFQTLYRLYPVVLLFFLTDQLQAVRFLSARRPRCNRARHRVAADHPPGPSPRSGRSFRPNFGQTFRRRACRRPGPGLAGRTAAAAASAPRKASDFRLTSVLQTRPPAPELYLRGKRKAKRSATVWPTRRSPPDCSGLPCADHHPLGSGSLALLGLRII